MDMEKIERAVRDILEAVGEDPQREGLVETPARVADGLAFRIDIIGERGDRLMALGHGREDDVQHPVHDPSEVHQPKSWPPVSIVLRSRMHRDR